MSGGSAGVKNLRAMFENKNNSDQSTSPPSRGRSPSRSISSANSRPVSKVRASFVAVERPGEGGQPSQWGLRKTSDVSSMAEVREEALLEDAQTAPAQSTSSEISTPRPEGPGLGAILKGSPFEYAPGELPVQSTPTAKSKTQAPVPVPGVPGGPAGKPQTNGNNTNKVASLVGKMQPRDQLPAKPDPGADKATKPVRALPAKVDTNTAASKSKESPTVPKKSPLAQKKPQASPTTATTDGTPALSTNGASFKPRGGVSKIQGIIASANRAKEERAKAEQSNPDSPSEDKKKSTPKEVKPPAVASKPTAASKAHAQKQDGQPTESPVKTSDAAKATKLPSAATAPTAASAARKDAKPEKDDTKKPATDRKSILPQAPRVANATTKASLAKKSSRASLAGGEDRSKARPSTSYKPADEGFLARMTRPTASSAQKVHSKVEVTSPPRPRQSSASHQAPKKLPRKSVSTVTKEPAVAKPAATEDNEETAQDRVQEDTAQAQDPEHSGQSDGEPGPAEETEVPSQQAEMSIVGA